MSCKQALLIFMVWFMRGILLRLRDWRLWCGILIMLLFSFENINRVLMGRVHVSIVIIKICSLLVNRISQMLGRWSYFVPAAKKFTILPNSLIVDYDYGCYCRNWWCILRNFFSSRFPAKLSGINDKPCGSFWTENLWVQNTWIEVEMEKIIKYSPYYKTSSKLVQESP